PCAAASHPPLRACPARGPSGRANLRRPDDARLLADLAKAQLASGETEAAEQTARASHRLHRASRPVAATLAKVLAASDGAGEERSEEHTSELQSRENLVCRLLL